MTLLPLPRIRGMTKRERSIAFRTNVIDNGNITQIMHGDSLDVSYCQTLSFVLPFFIIVGIIIRTFHLIAVKRETKQ